MGPWLRSHGRTTLAAPMSHEPVLQWGRGFAATEGGVRRSVRRDPKGFNGAVASQPRKGRLRHGGNPVAQLLQWGRGFAATEGCG